jgi:hypothetical protein
MVNGPDVADCNEIVFVNSTGKPHGLAETFSVVIGLKSLWRAVLMASRERTADVDGESKVVIEAVGERWSMSELSTHWLMFTVLDMGDLVQVAFDVQCWSDRSPDRRQFLATGQPKVPRGRHDQDTRQTRAYDNAATWNSQYCSICHRFFLVIPK